MKYLVDIINNWYLFSANLVDIHDPPKCSVTPACGVPHSHAYSRWKYLSVRLNSYIASP